MCVQEQSHRRFSVVEEGVNPHVWRARGFLPA